MRYLSVCSGIEAASVAWENLNWSPVGFSEISAFPCSVLKHRFPNVQNFGDMERFEEWPIEEGSVDILVGGTPCQSFSIAGLRAGLEDQRGNLALTYCRILQKLRPRWFVWENVPGVLSSNGGRDFGSILGAMAELGYGWAYRILDAQYFGVPQRRRRVFVVGHSGDWRRAAAVLFEPDSMCRDTEKGGKKKTSVAALTAAGVGTCGADDNQGQAGHLIASKTSPCLRSGNQYNNSDAIMEAQMLVTSTGNRAHCLNAGGMGRQDYETETMVTAFSGRSRGDDGRGYDRPPNVTGDVAGALDTVKPGNVAGPNIGVRRLTPLECERLQGLPDDWTLVPHGKNGKLAADWPRYKAIGNSMAVPVMRWLGHRIEAAENTQ